MDSDKPAKSRGFEPHSGHFFNVFWINFFGFCSASSHCFIHCYFSPFMQAGFMRDLFSSC